MTHRLKYQVQSSCCYWRRLSWPGLPRRRSHPSHQSPGSIQAYHRHWSYQDSKYLGRQHRLQPLPHLGRLRISAWTRTGAGWECSLSSFHSWPSARAISCARSRSSYLRRHPSPHFAALGQDQWPLAGKFCRSERQGQATLRRAASLTFAWYPSSASGSHSQWSHAARRGDTVWPVWIYRQTLGRSQLFRRVCNQVEALQCVSVPPRGMSWRWIASSTTAQWSSWTKYVRCLCIL